VSAVVLPGGLDDRLATWLRRAFFRLTCMLLPRRERSFRLRLLSRRDAMARNWEGCDFGRGLFYQSSFIGGLPGRRNTETRGRIIACDVELAGKALLDLGCNSGFLTCALARRGAKCVGVDHNPYLIDIATEFARHLNIEAVFIRDEIVDFCRKTNRRFDVVLLLSSHITNDDVSWECAVANIEAATSVLKAGGTLVFESHPPLIEEWGAGLPRIIYELSQRLDLKRELRIRSGSPMDRGRGLYVFHARDPALRDGG
jgi:SAM-dependent methyltransferase